MSRRSEQPADSPADVLPRPPVGSREARERRVEMIAAILLSIATVITAWSAYQATRWSGEQAQAYVTASAHRTESVRASTTVNRQVLIDVNVFLGWLDAVRSGHDALAGDIRDRMRDEFRPAFEAWLASAPEGQLPEGTPFTRPEYVLAAQQESERLEAEAAASFDAGQRANQISDDFVLATVMLASVLFFSGLGGTFDSFRAQMFLLVLAGLMLVGRHDHRPLAAPERRVLSSGRPIEVRRPDVAGFSTRRTRPLARATRSGAGSRVPTTMVPRTPTNPSADRWKTFAVSSVSGPAPSSASWRRIEASAT